MRNAGSQRTIEPSFKSVYFTGRKVLNLVAGTGFEPVAPGNEPSMLNQTTSSRNQIGSGYRVRTCDTGLSVRGFPS